MMTLEECVAKARDLRSRDQRDQGRLAFITAYCAQSHLVHSKPSYALFLALKFLHDPEQRDFNDFKNSWYVRFLRLHAAAAIRNLKG